MRFPRRNSRIEPLNRAIGAPVSDPARFKMRDLEPGRRPALHFMGRAGVRCFVYPSKSRTVASCTRTHVPGLDHAAAIAKPLPHQKPAIMEQMEKCECIE